MKLKCLIVEDEPLAQNVLKKYISKLPNLTLVEALNNAIDAQAYLHSHEVDILFLDIEMPELSGLEFLKSLTAQPQVILTTAYSQYGAESYEYGVVDYLLKPIPFDRFLKSINRAMDNLDQPKTIKADNTHEDHIFLKEDHVNQKICFSDIQYIEAYGNYLKIYSDKRRYLVRLKISEMEGLLPKNDFARIHKSYIVSLQRVTGVEGNRVLTPHKKLPIGSMYKLNFTKKMSLH